MVNGRRKSQERAFRVVTAVMLRRTTLRDLVSSIKKAETSSTLVCINEEACLLHRQFYTTYTLWSVKSILFTLVSDYDDGWLARDEDPVNDDGERVCASK